MAFKETLSTLENLRSLYIGGGDDSVFTPQQKGWISKLHKDEFGEPVRECSCKNKYTDAVDRLFDKLRRRGQIETESEFSLRAGDIIWLGTDCYSRHNLTDAIAREYLRLHPDEEWRLRRTR